METTKRRGEDDNLVLAFQLKKLLVTSSIKGKYLIDRISYN